MIRRYIYDPAADAVVEVGSVRLGLTAGAASSREEQEYRESVNTDPNPRAARRHRDAALERAGRREFAHARYGDERRWKDT